VDFVGLLLQFSTAGRMMPRAETSSIPTNLTFQETVTMGYVLPLLYLAAVVAALAGMWKMFEKLGKPGWAGIVPIYNAIVLTEVIKKPTWWAVGLIVPCTAIFFWIPTALILAKAFGKDTGFAVGMILLSPVFLPILGFGDAKFQGVSAS
jgi:Family of unknown function (DUF5684)